MGPFAGFAGPQSAVGPTNPVDSHPGFSWLPVACLASEEGDNLPVLLMPPHLLAESNSGEYELLVLGQSWTSVIVSVDPIPPSFMGAES